MFEPIDTEITTTDEGTYRIEIYPEDDPMSPREWSNLGVLVIDEDYLSIDETMHEDHTTGNDWNFRNDPAGAQDTAAGAIRQAINAVHDEQVSIPAACRWLRLVTGAWAVLPVHASDRRYDVAVSVGDADSMDTGAVSGFILDTATTRAEMGVTDAVTAEQWMVEEIAAFSRMTEGEYVRYIVERCEDETADPDDIEANPDAYSWNMIDGLSSIDDVTYAWTEARGVVEHDTTMSDRVLAMQV